MIKYNDDVIVKSMPQLSEKRLLFFKSCMDSLKFGGTIEEQPDMCIVQYHNRFSSRPYEWKIPLNLVELKPEPKAWWEH